MRFHHVRWFIWGGLLCISLLLFSFRVNLNFYQAPLLTTAESEVSSLDKLRVDTWHYLLKSPFIRLPNLKGYSIEERRHLLDVKTFLHDMKPLFELAVSFILFSLFVFFSQQLSSRACVMICRYVLLWFVMIIVGLFLFFDPLFLFLHEVLFNAGSYIFDASSSLILLFPYHYFHEFIIVTVLVAALFNVGLFLSCRFLSNDKL